MKTNNLKKNIFNFKFFILMAVLVIALLPAVAAKLDIDSISYDPAIIAAGDEVDIVLQFHATSTYSTEDKIGNDDYEFRAKLTADDALTQNYVIIQDDVGDNVQGTLLSGNYYNRIYRVKFMNDAPAGSYEFKLEGTWYHNGVPEDSSQYVRFKVPVKKEGIILDVSTLETFPGEIRPGDDYVKLTNFIQNVGQKATKSVEVKLDLPEGIDASYSNNNRVWIGGLQESESKQVEFYIDLDDDLEPGVYELKYEFTYSDLDDNLYTKTRELSLLVKSRPQLEVTGYKSELRAGSSGKLYVNITNTGQESAESVDVRIIKQNSQPFVIDVRSDYIGELEPGETGLAVFDIKANREAQMKEHDLKLLIRSKGDSDEGDDNIYTYNRRAKVDVIGEAKNYPLWVAVIVAPLIVLYIIVDRIFKARRARRNKK